MRITASHCIVTMSDGDHYTPIDCGLYSNYELAILRGWRLFR